MVVVSLNHQSDSTVNYYPCQILMSYKKNGTIVVIQMLRCFLSGVWRAGITPTDMSEVWCMIFFIISLL